MTPAQGPETQVVPLLSKEEAQVLRLLHLGAPVEVQPEGSHLRVIHDRLIDLGLAEVVPPPGRRHKETRTWWVRIATTGRAAGRRSWRRWGAEVSRRVP